MNLSNFLIKLKLHAAKILWIPLLLNILTFAANFILGIMDDGVIDEQRFHDFLRGNCSAQVVLLALVMALLKIRNKP